MSKEKLKVEKKLSKRFLGKLGNFKDKQERNFNKKMLKAYLRGAELFGFGKYQDKAGDWHTQYHKVLYKFV